MTTWICVLVTLTKFSRGTNSTPWLPFSSNASKATESAPMRLAPSSVIIRLWAWGTPVGVMTLVTAGAPAALVTVTTGVPATCTLFWVASTVTFTNGGGFGGAFGGGGGRSGITIPTGISVVIDFPLGLTTNQF